MKNEVSFLEYLKMLLKPEDWEYVQCYEEAPSLLEVTHKPTGRWFYTRCAGISLYAPTENTTPEGLHHKLHEVNFGSFFAIGFFAARVERYCKKQPIRAKDWPLYPSIDKILGDRIDELKKNGSSSDPTIH